MDDNLDRRIEREVDRAFSEMTAHPFSSVEHERKSVLLLKRREITIQQEINNLVKTLMHGGLLHHGIEDTIEKIQKRVAGLRECIDKDAPTREDLRDGLILLQEIEEEKDVLNRQLIDMKALAVNLSIHIDEYFKEAEEICTTLKQRQSIPHFDSESRMQVLRDKQTLLNNKERIIAFVSSVQKMTTNLLVTYLSRYLKTMQNAVELSQRDFNTHLADHQSLIRQEHAFFQNLYDEFKLAQESLQESARNLFKESTMFENQGRAIGQLSNDLTVLLAHLQDGRR